MQTQRSRHGWEVYPIDLEEGAEAARLTIMSRVLTRLIGELVPREVAQRSSLQVLDIGCGTGGWVHDVAYLYPKGEAVGIDASAMMLGLARSGADAQGLNNASFEQVDATGPLPFADGSFDVVQARCCTGFLSRDTWPLAVREWVRVTRPYGCLRLIETDGFGQGSDPALLQWQDMLQRAWRADPSGRMLPVTPHLAEWLHEAGLVELRTHLHVLDFSAPSDSEREEQQEEVHLSVAQCLEKTAFLLKPFVLKHLPLSATELDQCCEQMALGMMQAGFRGSCSYLEVVGTRPEGHYIQVEKVK